MIETIELPIAGMTCTSCTSRITRALRRIDGVGRVGVDLGRERATVTFDGERTSTAALADAVARAGYVPDTDGILRVAAPGPTLVDRLLRRS